MLHQSSILFLLYYKILQEILYQSCYMYIILFLIQQFPIRKIGPELIQLDGQAQTDKYVHMYTFCYWGATTMRFHTILYENMIIKYYGLLLATQ